MCPRLLLLRYLLKVIGCMLHRLCVQLEQSHLPRTLHVRRFSETLKARYQKCVDFDTTRKFLTDYIDSISYYNDKIEVNGSIPIDSGSEEKENTPKVAFNIKSTIPYSDRLKKSKGPINGSVPISRREHDTLLGSRS